MSYEQWKSVLQLSTRWGFASLRKLALKSIRPPTAHDKLVLARTYSVEQWVLPSLTALCSRELPLSLDEARQMDIEDVILVAAVREDLRGEALRFDAADIPQIVEMAQANNRLVGKVYGSTEQESGSTAGPVSKSVSASTTDLLADSLNANFASKLAPAESGGSQLPPMDEAPQTEKLDGNPSEEVYAREHFTLTTKVPVATHVATAGSTTAGDSRDGHGEVEGPRACIFNRATKDSLSVGTPVMVAEDAPVMVAEDAPVMVAEDAPVMVAEDAGEIPVRTKGGAGATTPVISCASGDDGDWDWDWSTLVWTKKKGASASTPVVPCGGGEDYLVTPARSKKKGKGK